MAPDMVYWMQKQEYKSGFAGEKICESLLYR